MVRAYMHWWLGIAALVAFPATVRAQVTFTDVTAATGVLYEQVTLAETEPCVDGNAACQGQLFTGGATAGDYNEDGCVDLFVTRYDATDILFENNCDGTFSDVSALVGLTASVQSNGAVFADVDSDRDLDLYVVTQRTDAHLLYINDGAHRQASGARPSFTEEAQARGAAVAPDPNRIRTGMSVSAGDFDRDGYLDLFTTEWNGQPPFACSETHARFLHNRGAEAPGFFTDMTEPSRAIMTFGSVGTTQVPLSFAPAFPDLDDDGWVDLAVASDGRTSQLFWNDANGRFTRGTEAAMVATDEFGMGSTFGDYDNDGDFDWFVTSIYEADSEIPTRDGNRLYRNEGGRVFSDQTDAAGVRDGAWGWGAAFFDYDNDGDLDLGHTNGFPAEEAFENDPVRLWRNDNAIMTEVAPSLGMTDTGDGRAYLTFDYDNDGDLDVFIANHHQTPVLYRNDGGNAADWVRVRARGVVSPAFGRGTKVTVMAEDGAQVRQIGVGSHFLGEGELVAHFGLGAGYADGGGTVDIRARFVSGRTVEMTDVAPNQTIEVVEPTEGLRPFARCTTSIVDCNDNSVVDLCDIAATPGLDANDDGVIDTCSAPTDPPACVRSTGNGMPDGGVDGGMDGGTDGGIDGGAGGADGGSDAGLDGGVVDAGPDAGVGGTGGGGGGGDSTGSGCAVSGGRDRAGGLTFTLWVVLLNVSFLRLFNNRRKSLTGGNL